MTEPLEGIRVLEMATALQGPAAALYLSDMGADVVDAEKRMLDGAAQARSDLASVTGYEDGPPLLTGTTLADTAGAMQLALAVMTALVARERHGVGQKVNCSSYGAQLWLQMWKITHTALTGHLLSRTGPHHPNVPGSYGIYGTADGKGIFLAFPTTEEAWQAFCAFGGEADLGFDELEHRAETDGDERRLGRYRSTATPAPDGDLREQDDGRVARVPRRSRRSSGTPSRLTRTC